MGNKSRLSFKAIASFVLLAFAGQALLFYAPAYAELGCWNDGAKVIRQGGSPVLADAPKGDANPPGSQKAGDPVNLATGNFAYEHVDFTIPSRGLPLEFKRYYNNQEDYEGPFGIGWDHNYNIFIVEAVDQGTTYLIRHNPEGSKDKFTKNSDSTYTAPDGVFDILAKDAQGYTITTKHGVVYRFNAAGFLASITDCNANQITLTYDAATGVLTKITDSVGRNITLAYTPENKVSSITDFTGRTWKYTYQNGDLTSVTTPATQDFTSGTTTTYGYDNHNLKSITDPRGNAFLGIIYDNYDRVDRMDSGAGLYDFDYSENLTAMSEPSGNLIHYQLNNDGTVRKKVDYAMAPLLLETAYEYNLNKLITKTTYPKGNSILYEYDNKGNLLRVTRRPGSLSAEPDTVNAFTCEPKFNFIKDAVDPLGRATSYNYDAKGNLARIVYPEVNGQAPQINFTYNAYGQVLSVADPNGNVTAYEYSPATGYLAKVIRAAGALDLATEMSYDPAGNLKSLKDPKGNTTSFEYDSHNNLIKATSPAPFNYISRNKYDANDNLIQADRETRDSANPWQSVYYTYDVMDRLETVKDSAGNTTAYGYDKNGNRASVTDALSNRTAYAYDGRNLLTSTTDAQGNITEYNYDENGSLKSIIDPSRNATTYTYDGFDRPAKTTYADGSSEEYVYDANSNLKTKKNPNGQTIAYDYDVLNRVTSLRGASAASDAAISYGYDQGSRLKEVTDANGKIEYVYDAAGRITQVTYPGSKSVSYAYDANSNRAKLIYPDATSITYGYDELNRLAAVKDGAGAAIASYSYDALSRRTQLAYANNAKTLYEYDTLNRLVSLRGDEATEGEARGSAESDRTRPISYTYDKVGNRLSMATPAGTHNYTYDRLYQLKGADYPTGYFAADSSFNYDYLGNRTSTTSSSTTSYSSNNLNQYTNVGGTGYAYDLNGNLTSDGTSAYAYDYENRLASATKAGTSAAYTYDPFGRRTSTSLREAAGDKAISYLYDEDQIIAEYDGSGNLTAKYIYGPGIDEPICRIVPPSSLRGGAADEAIYYYHFDGLGSVTGLTNSTGSTVESYSYDAFGNPLIKDASGNTLTASVIGNRYMFTGREYDSDTGLYYYRARYYSPTLGRFLQRDPIGINGGINLYSYVRNNPTNFVDRLGLKPGDVYAYYDNNFAQWVVGLLTSRQAEGHPSYGHVAIEISNGELLTAAPGKGVYIEPLNTLAGSKYDIYRPKKLINIEALDAFAKGVADRSVNRDGYDYSALLGINFPHALIVSEYICTSLIVNGLYLAGIKLGNMGLQITPNELVNDPMFEKIIKHQIINDTNSFRDLTSERSKKK